MNAHPRAHLSCRRLWIDSSQAEADKPVVSDAVQRLPGEEEEEDTPEDGGSKLTVRAPFMRLSTCRRAVIVGRQPHQQEWHSVLQDTRNKIIEMECLPQAACSIHFALCMHVLFAVAVLDLLSYSDRGTGCS